MKKIMQLFLVLAIIVTSSVYANAASNVKLGKQDVEFDTRHGHYFSVAGMPNRVLNQFTSSYPKQGTLVTTWTKDRNDITQAWDYGYVGNGRFIIVANSDRSLAIDYDRNYTYPKVQLYSWEGDYYDDVVLSEGIHGGDRKIKLANRDRFVQVTNENTTVYDANGKLCQWTANGTDWVHEID